MKDPKKALADFRAEIKKLERGRCEAGADARRRRQRGAGVRTLLERCAACWPRWRCSRIMALTLVDVVGAQAAAGSVPGSLELTELLMVVVIFAGLPLVSLRGEHVVFDSLDPLLPRARAPRAAALVDRPAVPPALAGWPG